MVRCTATTTCSPTRLSTSAHQHADSGPRPDVDRRTSRRQACTLYRADGHKRSMSAGKSSNWQDWTEIHDGRNGQFIRGSSFALKTCTRRANWAKSTWRRRTRKTWTAGRNTGSDDPYALRNAHRRQPRLGLLDGRAEHVRVSVQGRSATTFGKKSGNPFAVESCHIKEIKDSDGACTSGGFLRHGPAVSRKLRRLRHEKELRVTPGQPAHPVHRQEARAGDTLAGSRFPIPPTCCRNRFGSSPARSRIYAPSFIQRRARWIAPTWSTSLSPPWSMIASRGRTPCNRPTGPAWASAPTSRP